MPSRRRRVRQKTSLAQDRAEARIRVERFVPKVEPTLGCQFDGEIRRLSRNVVRATSEPTRDLALEILAKFVHERADACG